MRATTDALPSPPDSRPARRWRLRGKMPPSVRVLLVVVVAAGAAVVAACAVRVAGEPLEHGAVLLVLTAGILLAELFPIRFPGNAEETSFSTSFAFAVMATHGPEYAVLVASGCLIAADAIRRRPAVKVAYNAGQYAISWGAAGLAYIGLAGGPPDELTALGSTELLALLPAGVVHGLVNGSLAPLPGVLLSGGSVREQLRRDRGFVVVTTLLLVALAPIVVVVAANDLWLVPLFGVPLIGIQLASRQLIMDEQRARIDTLTGALTRRELETQLGRRLAGHGPVPAVVVVDLVDFSDVNDALGHRVGDAVLTTVAARLAVAAAEEGPVARVAGDRFALLCAAPRVELAAELLARALERPVTVENLELDVRAAMGLALGPADSATQLLREAEIALRAAKDRGQPRLRFEADLHAEAADRLALASDLRRAIGAGELVVHYQPKLDIRSGALAGVEALVRWDRPGHGLVPPDAFIGLAERTGLIRPLTSAVLGAAFRDQAAWAADGLQVPVAVNLSARALHAGVVAEVRTLLAGAAGALELEITETTVMRDPERDLVVLEGLAALGVRLSVDDFGTGHSSLAYLARLPVAALKIDRAFVGGLDAETANRSIVSTTVELGHQLGLEVVAEGVEDDATLATLRALGCDLAQGYGIARPMPAGAVPEWAAARAARVSA